MHCDVLNCDISMCIILWDLWDPSLTERIRRLLNVNLVCVSKLIMSCRSLCLLVSCDAGLSGPFQTSARTHCHLFTHLLPLSVPCWNSDSCLNFHSEHISVEYHIWTFVYMADFPHQVYLKSLMHKVYSEQLDIQHWLFPLCQCNHLFCLWCVQAWCCDPNLLSIPLSVFYLSYLLLILASYSILDLFFPATFRLVSSRLIPSCLFLSIILTSPLVCFYISSSFV